MAQRSRISRRPKAGQQGGSGGAASSPPTHERDSFFFADTGIGVCWGKNKCSSEGRVYRPPMDTSMGVRGAKFIFQWQ